MIDAEKDLESLSADPVVKAMVPVIAMLLNVACPAIPAVVWTAILTALISGDLTPEHIEDFVRDHNIQVYSDPSDFPPPKGRDDMQ